MILVLEDHYLPFGNWGQGTAKLLVGRNSKGEPRKEKAVLERVGISQLEERKEKGGGKTPVKNRF